MPYLIGMSDEDLIQQWNENCVNLSSVLEDIHHSIEIGDRNGHFIPDKEDMQYLKKYVTLFESLLNDAKVMDIDLHNAEQAYEENKLNYEDGKSLLSEWEWLL